MRIWDAHTHLGKSKMWNEQDPTRMPEDLIREMDQHNIEKAIIFANPSDDVDYFTRNQEISDYVKQYSNRFIGFARVDPHLVVESKRHLEAEIKELGLRGLKLHPVVEKFDPLDEHYFYIYQVCEKEEIPILFHFEKELTLGQLPEVFPNLKIIFGHLNIACLDYLKKYPNVYAETSGCKVKTLQDALEIDQDHIFFGSDYPYLEILPELTKIDKAITDEEVKEKVLFTNLANFLGFPVE